MALCNATPDFNSDEASSVRRNKEDLSSAVQDMADHLPKEDPGKGCYQFIKTISICFTLSAMQGLTCHDIDVKNWTLVCKRRRFGKLRVLFCCSRGP